MGGVGVGGAGAGACVSIASWKRPQVLFLFFWNPSLRRMHSYHSYDCIFDGNIALIVHQVDIHLLAIVLICHPVNVPSHTTPANKHGHWPGEYKQDRFSYSCNMVPTTKK